MGHKIVHNEGQHVVSKGGRVISRHSSLEGAKASIETSHGQRGSRDKAVAVRLGEDKSKGTSGVPEIRRGESTVEDTAGHDPKNGQFAKGGSSERKSAVEKQIQSSSRHGPKIGKKEGKMIHGLLKGWRGDYGAKDAASHAKGCVCADCMERMVRDAGQKHDPKSGQFAKGGGTGSKKKKKRGMMKTNPHYNAEETAKNLAESREAMNKNYGSSR